MPNYVAGTAVALSPGDTINLFNAETPTPPQASIAFTQAYAAQGQPPGATFQAIFPGTASVQVQGSNIDVDADYANVGAAITTSGGAVTDTSRLSFYRAKVTALTGGSITVAVAI
jgi:hypothetical protein